ncbi:hypothetical protein FHG87_008284 [Trinorchestia longiramus]|nr:hypothetical protein FHG87_008284 [Trinorchestia longiramus]
MPAIFPPWCATGIKICTSMLLVRKSEMDPTAAPALFIDHSIPYNESLHYTDEPRNKRGTGFSVETDPASCLHPAKQQSSTRHVYIRQFLLLGLLL